MSSSMRDVFYTATRCLATAPGDLRKRLEVAMIYLRCRIGGPNDDLPPGLAEKAADLFRRSTRVAAEGDLASIKATCRAMGDGEAEAIAAGVVELYGDVCRNLGPDEGEGVSPRKPDEGPP